MKQKYVVMRSDDNQALIIKEFAELDKDIMSLLCEETYGAAVIESAIKKGKEALIEALRTPNMYPAKVYAEKIADSVITLFGTNDQDPVEVFFDDLDFITAARRKAVEIEQKADESSDIDGLIEDEFDEEYDEKPSIDKINSSISVEDDDMTDFDEES